ncbi:MAG: dTDP-4-dehydrorhamnose reductase [Paludibacteraceae bacterium]|nr:dTDP-4-dehydrorhamnose reductase [Paludibacteraceae bacterium]
MKILITGAYGQLGNELRVASAHHANHTYLFTDADTLDICNLDQLDAYFSQHSPDILVNCAAYTAVDKAEDDQDRCALINTEAVKNIGVVARKHNARVIHISTDYVFDGTSHIPYTEDMPVCPTNVYGNTKLQGEKELLMVAPDSVIIRTSWLYSSFGNNFVKTMLRLSSERDSLNVIFDQVGTPTYAADLAEAILTIIDQNEWKAGIYHFSNEGVCSWYDFCKVILEKAGNNTCKVFPIESSAYPVRTPRPHYSVLNKGKIKHTFNIEIPYWINALERCIKILNSQPS